MRELNEHKVNPVNDLLMVTVVDEPGAGGAHHKYEIGHNGALMCKIDFQNGPINEAGINGLTHESLLAIVADRLRSFQNGPYRCKENACALTHIEEAMLWLHKRTWDRMKRGVEGSNKV